MCDHGATEAADASMLVEPDGLIKPAAAVSVADLTSGGASAIAVLSAGLASATVEPKLGGAAIELDLTLVRRAASYRTNYRLHNRCFAFARRSSWISPEKPRRAAAQRRASQSARERHRTTRVRPRRSGCGRSDCGAEARLTGDCRVQSQGMRAGCAQCTHDHGVGSLRFAVTQPLVPGL